MVGLVFGLPLLLGRPQAGLSLASFLSADAQRGRLVVGAEAVTTTDPKPDLASFGRKEVRIGGVAAIVPRQMVVIDDSLAQEPNLYDGLPRTSKVTYLLSTLDKEQLRIATTKGIGFDDLRGEQRNVFRSILPESIAWANFTVDKDGIPEQQGSPSTVSGPQLNLVRLRFSRQTMLIPTHNLPNGRISYVFQDLGRQEVPGEKIRMRTEDPETDQANRLYGVLIRKTAVNEPKPSDLNYKDARWNTPVAIPVASTVGEVLSRIAAATHSEILADQRAAGLSVSFNGKKARAGDLLQAVALAVTGTYRKVGGVFQLTSDLEGQGARQLRLARWASLVGDEAGRRAQEWRMKVGASGALRAVGFSPNDPTGPNDAMKARMQEEEGSTTHKPLPLSDLPEFARGMVNRFSDPQDRFDQAGVSSRIVFSFVLPGGEELEPEGEQLGRLDQFFGGATSFRRPIPTRPIQKPMRVPKVAPPKSVVLRAEDAATAKSLVATASGTGLDTVWLETDRPEVLAAGVAQGLESHMHVGLAYRPFPLSKGGQDMTLLGEPTVSLSLAGGLANLEKVPGLSGVLVLGTQPRGYEAKDGLEARTLGSVTEALMLHSGYSTEGRLGFLRKYNVDPVDIGYARLRLPVELSVPFFYDACLGRADTADRPPTELSDSWREWRSAGFEARVQALFGLLGGLPTFVEPVYMESSVLSGGSIPTPVWAVAWTKGQAIPTAKDRTFASEGPAGTLGVIALNPAMLGNDEAIGPVLSFAFRGASHAMAVDLTQLSAAQAIRLLGDWLAR